MNLSRPEYLLLFKNHQENKTVLKMLGTCYRKFKIQKVLFPQVCFVLLNEKSLNPRQVEANRWCYLTANSITAGHKSFVMYLNHVMLLISFSTSLS